MAGFSQAPALSRLDADTATRNDLDIDFDRRVRCVFGLPVDDQELPAVEALLRQRLDRRLQSVLSTININWVVTSWRRPEFRDTVIDSDVCTIDGMPLLWLARALGMHSRTPVAGSSLIEQLADRPRRQQLSMFLFGGNPGVGGQAQREVNGNRTGLRVIGHHNPGFGDLSPAATDRALTVVNRQASDIMLVALGAYRGQCWIGEYRHRINAGVISHLGATIDFLAKTERRAPLAFQRVGLEWFWRILQRPSLWRRYADDGARLATLLVSHWLPYRRLLRGAARRPQAAGRIACRQRGDTVVLVLEGGFVGRPQDRRQVREQFRRAAASGLDVELDLTGVSDVDDVFLGYLLLLLKHTRRNRKRLQAVRPNRRVAKMFRLNLLDEVVSAGRGA